LFCVYCGELLLCSWCGWRRDIEGSETVLDLLDYELDSAIRDADVDSLILVVSLLLIGIVMLGERLDEVCFLTGIAILLRCLLIGDLQVEVFERRRQGVDNF
jgi:hypothetical protein